MAKFDVKDDGVVVIIGSGAGGGTVGNELAQKGVKVVILEAGPRIELQDFVNNEWESFTQLAWTDMRTTSGNGRVGKDSANLPAWIVKSVGGSTVHWAGASLRFQEHEFKTKSVYGNVAGANLLDWPITLAEMEPYYAKAEDKMGVTRTNNIPGLPGNNNFKVLEAGAKKVGYKEVHTGRMAINSEPRDGRGSCQQIGFCFQGCKSGAKWSTLYAEIPKGEATGNLEVRPNSMALKIEHDASGKATGGVYSDEAGAMQRQKACVVAGAQSGNVLGGRGHAAGTQSHHTRSEGQGQVRRAGGKRAFRRSSQRHRDAQSRLQTGRRRLRSCRGHRDLSDATLSKHPQSGHQPHAPEAEGWRGQQFRPHPRHQEPVHLRWQPVHQWRRLQSNANDRVTRDPAGGPHRRCDAAQGDLSSHN